MRPIGRTPKICKDLIHVLGEPEILGRCINYYVEYSYEKIYHSCVCVYRAEETQSFTHGDLIANIEEIRRGRDAFFEDLLVKLNPIFLKHSKWKVSEINCIRVCLHGSSYEIRMKKSGVQKEIDITVNPSCSCRWTE